MPPAVKRVEISKKDGSTRPLGIPTVSDRIAQMVVKMHLEPVCEVVFHENSYGYRSARSALMALEQTRKRCWEYFWVLDLDIKSFFDSIPHDLLMKAVKRHTQEPWILLYIQRWLEAPVQFSDGHLQSNDRGTPQGSVISPMLANLYLHYAFDDWMKREIPNCPFERYADDIVVHCRTELQAHYVKKRIKRRLAACGLILHPEKTRIVYCGNVKIKRHGKGNPLVSFDYLGYTFKPRLMRKRKGRKMSGLVFTPAVSLKSKKAICARIRSWNLKHRSDMELNNIASMINPVVRGWLQYYGRFRKSELYYVLYLLNNHLFKWAQWKYRIKSWKQAIRWFKRVAGNSPNLFVHWKFVKV